MSSALVAGLPRYRVSRNHTLAARTARPFAPGLGHRATMRRRGDTDASTGVTAVAEAAQSTSSAGTIPKDEIIEMTKKFVGRGFQEYSKEDEDILSEDMIFRGPIVGPLMKPDYVAAINSFKVSQAFPDIENTSFGFDVDPDDPYRVWFLSKTSGHMTGKFPFGKSSLPPTGNPIRNGVSAASVIWTPDRKVKYLSAGYCVDRINSDTPNGTMKVAVVGLLRAANAAHIWSIVTNPVVQFFTNLFARLQGKPGNPGPKPFDELPAWWRELPDGKLRGAQNYNK